MDNETDNEAETADKPSVEELNELATRRAKQAGMMQIGNCRVKLDKDQNDVPVIGVTPAEVQVLRRMHSTNVKGDPIHALVPSENPASVRAGFEADGVTPKTRARTMAEEARRLVHKYGKKQIDAMYPGENKVLPLTFAEVREMPTVAQSNDKVDEDLGLLAYPTE